MALDSQDIEYPDESPVITLPEDKRGRIETKLQEYRERLVRLEAEEPNPDKQKFTGKIPNRILGTLYKIAICEELLNNRGS